MSDAKEIARLERKHRDIALHGAGALAKEAEREHRQKRMQAFVNHYNLSCFGCGSRLNPWAKTGTTHERHWAICIQCVRTSRSSERGRASDERAAASTHE